MINALFALQPPLYIWSSCLTLIYQIRRDREAKRTQLQKDLDKKLADLNQRIKQTVDAHIQQLSVCFS